MQLVFENVHHHVPNPYRTREQTTAVLLKYHVGAVAHGTIVCQRGKTKAAAHRREEHERFVDELTRRYAWNHSTAGDYFIEFCVNGFSRAASLYPKSFKSGFGTYEMYSPKLERRLRSH